MSGSVANKLEEGLFLAIILSDAGLFGDCAVTLLDAVDKRSDVVGEDTLELFQAVEDSFGIDLGDYYQLADVTVGDLAKRICELAKYSPEEKCLSALAFFRIRRVLAPLCGVAGKSIRPSTRLTALLPWRKRTSMWSKLREALDLDVPNLAMPGWVLLLCLAISVALGTTAYRLFGSPIMIVHIVFCGGILFVLCLRAAMPLARNISPDCDTVGGLAKVMLAHNYSKFAANGGSSLERGVFPALRQIVADGAGMQVDQITSETRIPTDLNIY